jgi:hypothetical protein
MIMINKKIFSGGHDLVLPCDVCETNPVLLSKINSLCPRLQRRRPAPNPTFENPSLMVTQSSKELNKQRAGGRGGQPRYTDE